MRSWYNLATSILKVYITLFVEDIRVSGKEYIPAGPKIIVANHPNATDAFMLPFLFPEKLHFLIQASVFEKPLVGRLLAYADQIPVIKRQGHDALKAAREKLIQGGTIVIFPEGRLNNDGELHRGRTGAALLAVQTGIPVLPLGFYVPAEFLREFKGRVDDRSTSSRWQFGGSCFIRVGHPMQFPSSDEIDKHIEHLHELTEQIMGRISELVSQAKQDAGVYS